MKAFLESNEVINWQHPDVLDQANKLAAGSQAPEIIARRCFEWVRDEIKHSADHSLPEVTCCASDVLRVGGGYCYSKSHLLAALLRANGIPAGFCYQRLRLDANGSTFCLHGLNGVFLPALGWYRIDPRGNRPDINAQFSPPVECLPFEATHPGEADCRYVWADPLPVVVHALRTHTSTKALSGALPDLDLSNEREQAGHTARVTVLEYVGTGIRPQRC
jgi:transglutaminase-like putative cysteine protease